MTARRPRDSDYTQLLAFRTELRSFLLWSEETARAAGLTPALHQLLLAVRGACSDEGPTIGDVAESMLVRHHTAVELAQRAEREGLLERLRDEADHRRVHLRLTPAGAAKLEEISALHLRNIAPLAKRLQALAR